MRQLATNIFVILLVIIPASIILWFYRKEKEYKKHSGRYKKSYMLNLYDMIKNKNDYNSSVYKQFIKLWERIDIKLTYDESEVFKFPITSVFKSAFGNCGIVSVKDWNKLIINFKEILFNYQNQTRTNEDMPSKEIAELLNKLDSMIANMAEIKCFECGALITKERSKCSKCGWTWNQPQNKSTA